ncbi:hypothetical protein BC008_28945 [Mastigocoleus testarum BC008]|uniref:Uncharacterized protein n=1 Tax=Mastigocoleus testarum BC008 TaxID=371196 RepID=A0A0V7ZRN1_9CYAN|nr:hypothetical protein BC008_28945 [Mastigocoleus testarum BC008]
MHGRANQHPVLDKLLGHILAFMFESAPIDLFWISFSVIEGVNVKALNHQSNLKFLISPNANSTIFDLLTGNFF